MTDFLNDIQPDIDEATGADNDDMAWMKLPETPDEPEEYQEVTADFMKRPRRANGAAGYTDKANLALTAATSFCLGREELLPDAAALITYGPKITVAWGDLAATDERVAAIINAMSAGVSNPYLAMVASVMPFALQIVRNHEPVLEPKPRSGLKIPFTKARIRIPFKVGVRLGRLPRAVTAEPETFSHYVLTQPKVVKKLSELGFDVGKIAAATTRRR